MGNCLQRSRGGSGSGGGGEHCANKRRAVWAEEKVVAEKQEEEEQGTCKGARPPPVPATDQVKHCANKRAVWADEKVVAEKKEEEEEERCKGASSRPVPATDQVKIRITKNQLVELLRSMEKGNQDGGAPVQEVITGILGDPNRSTAGDTMILRRGFDSRKLGQWRPSLQTIPE